MLKEVVSNKSNLTGVICEMKRFIEFIRSKIILIVLLIIGIVAVVTLFWSKQYGVSSEEIGGFQGEKLYKYKSLYVGDASNVGNLVDNMPFARYKTTYSLQTDKEPFGMTVNYKIKIGEISNVDKQLSENAVVIFSLIDNVNNITFNLNDGVQDFSYNYSREFFLWALGQDVKVYSTSLEKFRDEFLPMVIRWEWTKVELYIWRKKDTMEVYYRLFPDVMDSKTTEMIYDYKEATKDLDDINKKLSWYTMGTALMIRHDSSFTKDEITRLSDTIIFPGTSKSIGVFGDIMKNDVKAEVANSVEQNLSIITSPLSSSNPEDYIKVHDTEYQTILKMGDASLNYMLSCFKGNNAKGLRGHIMMRLCQEILGDRNNVQIGTYESPEEWYEKLEPYTAKSLPKFKYTGIDPTEKLVYAAALKKYGGQDANDTLTVVAPRIFGTSEENDELKIFATIYYNSYKLYDKTLTGGSAGIVPCAIVFTKESDGTFVFKKYIEAMDGEDFGESIKAFCGRKNDISLKILEHYSNYADLFDIMNQNLKNYSIANGLGGINLKQSDGKVVPIL